MENEDDESVASLFAALGSAFLCDVSGKKPLRPGGTIPPSRPVGFQVGEVVAPLPPPAPTPTAAPVYRNHTADLEPRVAALERVGKVAGNPAPKELTDVEEAQMRLVRRVNSLEDARRSVGCLKVVVVMFMILMACVLLFVGSALVLAYAEHKWDVPVFTGLTRGR